MNANENKKKSIQTQLTQVMIVYLFEKVNIFYRLNSASMLVKRGSFYLWFICTLRIYKKHKVNLSFEKKKLQNTESRFLKILKIDDLKIFRKENTNYYI